MGRPARVEDGAPGFVVALGLCDPTRDDEAVTNGAPGKLQVSPLRQTIGPFGSGRDDRIFAGCSGRDDRIFAGCSGREDRVECGREDGLWWGQASRRP